jgi:hypothetical protein
LYITQSNIFIFYYTHTERERERENLVSSERNIMSSKALSFEERILWCRRLRLPLGEDGREATDNEDFPQPICSKIKNPQQLNPPRIIIAHLLTVLIPSFAPQDVDFRVLQQPSSHFGSGNGLHACFSHRDRKPGLVPTLMLTIPNRSSQQSSGRWSSRGEDDFPSTGHLNTTS